VRLPADRQPHTNECRSCLDTTIVSAQQRP
jgi:hypothetical protein